MANPFLGTLTQTFKDLHSNMIDAILEGSSTNTAGCTVACEITYVGSKVEDISGTNTADPIGNKPPSIFSHGGPSFRPDGDDVKPSETTATIYLLPIWDSREWILTPLASTMVNSPDMHVQTLAKVADLVTLKRASRMVIDTTLEGKVRHTFERVGEPEPCGLGQSSHIVTMWKKIG